MERDPAFYGPYGCANCGLNRSFHGRQYGGCSSIVWAEPPSDLVKARMRARRAERRGDAS